MADHDESSVSGGWAIFRRLAEGGLPQLLMSKPISDAIGRLVGGVTDIPAAYLERHSQAIRDDTLARSKVVADISEAAAKSASGDPAIVERALHRWISNETRKQVIREDVARRTLEHLAEEPPPEAQGDGPSSDFMDVFSDVVEKASSYALRDMLSRVLAGEIRHPGTVSRRTLHAVSLLDQAMAQALLALRPRVCSEGWIPLIGSMANQENARNIDLLESASVLRTDNSAAISLNENNEALVPYGDNGIVIKCRGLRVFFVGRADVTSIGKEILALFPPIESYEIEEMAADFAGNEHVISCFIAELIRGPEGYSVISQRSVK